MPPTETDQTRTTVELTPTIEFSRTITTQDQLREAGDLLNHLRMLRDDTTLLEDEASSTHRSAFVNELDRRTGATARRSVQDLVEELATLGFGWRDVARLVGVSVPAIRKWRQGENTTGENRKAVAQLVAFVELLSSERMVSDVPGWLEVPLSANCPLTGIDVYSGGRPDLLHERACLRMSDEEVLDSFAPGWLQSYSSNVEVFTASDGEHGLRIRNSEG